MARKLLKKFLRYDVFSTQTVPVVVVFLMMMMLVGVSWRTASRAVVESKNEEVAESANYIEPNIQQRLLLNENTLRAAAGMFENPNPVTRQQWKNFVDSLELELRMPGILGLGYIEITDADSLPEVVRRVQSEGIKDFAFRPQEPARDIYTIVTMMEPQNDRNRRALGVDPYIEVNRREAMDKARDSGTTALTDVSKVLQNDGTQKNGITMFHPVYRRNSDLSSPEQRRKAIMGFVYAPLSTEALFAQIFPEKNPELNFTVYDIDQVNNGSILYQQFPEADYNSYEWLRENKIGISDQTWLISFGVREEIVPEAIRNRPRSVIFGGTIFAIIVTAIVHMLLQRRTKIIKSRQDRRIERAKDNLLSLASHQLRTPATGVKQYLGMALEGFTGELTGEQREVLSRAFESNERQLRIINEFLYLAKADANRIVASPQRFKLVELVNLILDDMRSTIADAGHTIRVVQKSRSLSAYADKHSARMIIENLISNAIKYTPEGGQITITIKKLGNKSQLSVEDNGVGIDSKDYHRLFKQFSRIPNKLTKQTTGSGIGLYLAQHLARVNSGSVTFKSVKGEGSIFTVTFPHKTVK